MLKETTSAGGSFGPGPKSGRFVGGINLKYNKKKIKEQIKVIRERWIKHEKPTSAAKVPQPGVKGPSQNLLTFPSNQQDSAADFWKRILRVSSKKTFK